MFVAWDDDMPWSARDERVDFDGVAGYPESEGALADPELAAVLGLRGALAELYDLLDAVTA